MRDEDATGWRRHHPVTWGLAFATTKFLLTLAVFRGEYWPVWLGAAVWFGLCTYWVARNRAAKDARLQAQG